MDTVRKDRLSRKRQRKREFVGFLKLQKKGKTLKYTQTKTCSYEIHDSFNKHTKLHRQLMLAHIMLCISLVAKSKLMCVHDSL